MEVHCDKDFGHELEEKHNKHCLDRSRMVSVTFCDIRYKFVLTNSCYIYVHDTLRYIGEK